MRSVKGPPRRRFVDLVPVLVAGLGWLVLLFASVRSADGGSLSELPVLLLWLIAIYIVADAWPLLRSRPIRVATAAGMTVACVVLTWEGGLFFLPAAAVLFVRELSFLVRELFFPARPSDARGDQGD